MITVRNYIAGEHLAWTDEEIGWPAAVLDPEWVWLVFDGERMAAMLVTAKVMNSILVIRLLSARKTGWWLRPLWRAVRVACDNRKIAGFWSVMDNEREAERKLLVLLGEGRGGCSALLTRTATGSWVSGRF